MVLANWFPKLIVAFIFDVTHEIHCYCTLIITSEQFSSQYLQALAVESVHSLRKFQLYDSVTCLSFTLYTVNKHQSKSIYYSLSIIFVRQGLHKMHKPGTRVPPHKDYTQHTNYRHKYKTKQTATKTKHTHII